MSTVRSGAYSQNPEPAQRGHSVYSSSYTVYIDHSVYAVYRDLYSENHRESP
jgi:hypothetical protein